MSLRAKITAALVGLVLLLGLAGTLHARVTLGGELRNELIQRGTTIASDVANRSEEALITNDVFAVHELISAARSSHKDVRYLFLVDGRGEVRAKTFSSGLPPGLQGANGLRQESVFSVRRLASDEGPLQDIAYPVMEGRLGTVRIGLSENRLLARVETFTWELLGLTGGVTALALVVSSLLALIMTRPLAQLATVARAVGRGDLSQRVDATSDEVGRLGTAFNTMIEDLAASRQEIEQSNRALLRRSRELATLNAVAVTVSQSMDLQPVMHSALDQVLGLMEADAGGILLWDHGESGLTYRAQRGLSAAYVAGVAGLRRGEGVAGRVAATGEPVVLDDIATDRRVTREAVRHEGLHSFTSVPLRAKERIVGVLNLARRGWAPFDARDVELLTAIGHQVGVAVENAGLWEELKEKERVRSELLQKVISAQEEERRRIARELHDELAQGLTALLMGLGRLSQSVPGLPARTTVLVDSVKQFASRAVDDTRRLIHDLRPPVLDDHGLLSAVRMLAETRLEQQGVTVTINADGLQHRLPAHLEVAVFRVLQEAISNCARHAGSTAVQISLQAEANRFRATIADDGIGFDPAAAARGSDGKRPLGLLGMRERASLLGGSLEIRTLPGRGTTLVLDLPLDAALAPA